MGMRKLFFVLSCLLFQTSVVLSAVDLAFSTNQYEDKETNQMFDNADVYQAILLGELEVPPVQTAAAGFSIVTLRIIDGVPQMRVTTIFSNLKGNLTRAGIHIGLQGQNGPQVFPLVTTATLFHPQSGIIGPINISLTSNDVALLKHGSFYVNISSTFAPAGEIRGNIFIANGAFNASLSGDQEVPPSTSLATGTGLVLLSFVPGLPPPRAWFASSLLTVDKLQGNLTAAFIHQAPSGTNGPVAFVLEGPHAPINFPTGTIAGLNEITPANVTTFFQGLYYINIYTNVFPLGEMRGQLLRLLHAGTGL